MLRLPRRGLAKHRDSRGHSTESYRCVVPTRLFPLPHNVNLARLGVQPQRDHFPTDWLSRHGGGYMRDVPRKQQLHDAADRLLRLPRGSVQHHNESGPRGSRIPDNLRDLPYDDNLARRNIQSYLFPRESRQRQRRVRYVPYQSRELLGFPMHAMPRRRERGEFQSPERRRVCIQQRELLSMPYALTGGRRAADRWTLIAKVDLGVQDQNVAR
jgi:hypothetical protein